MLAEGSDEQLVAFLLQEKCIQFLFTEITIRISEEDEKSQSCAAAAKLLEISRQLILASNDIRIVRFIVDMNYLVDVERLLWLLAIDRFDVVLLNQVGQFFIDAMLCGSSIKEDVEGCQHRLISSIEPLLSLQSACLKSKASRYDVIPIFLEKLHTILQHSPWNYIQLQEANSIFFLLQDLDAMSYEDKVSCLELLKVCMIFPLERIKSQFRTIEEFLPTKEIATLSCLLQTPVSCETADSVWNFVFKTLELVPTLQSFFVEAGFLYGSILFIERLLGDEAMDLDAFSSWDVIIQGIRLVQTLINGSISAVQILLKNHTKLLVSFKFSRVRKYLADLLRTVLEAFKLHANSFDHESLSHLQKICGLFMRESLADLRKGSSGIVDCQKLTSYLCPLLMYYPVAKNSFYQNEGFELIHSSLLDSIESYFIGSHQSLERMFASILLLHAVLINSSKMKRLWRDSSTMTSIEDILNSNLISRSSECQTLSAVLGTWFVCIVFSTFEKPYLPNEILKTIHRNEEVFSLFESRKLDVPSCMLSAVILLSFSTRQIQFQFFRFLDSYIKKNPEPVCSSLAKYSFFTFFLEIFGSSLLDDALNDGFKAFILSIISSFMRYHCSSEDVTTLIEFLEDNWDRCSSLILDVLNSNLKEACQNAQEVSPPAVRISYSPGFRESLVIPFVDSRVAPPSTQFTLCFLLQFIESDPSLDFIDLMLFDGPNGKFVISTNMTTIRFTVETPKQIAREWKCEHKFDLLRWYHVSVCLRKKWIGDPSLEFFIDGEMKASCKSFSTFSLGDPVRCTVGRESSQQSMISWNLAYLFVLDRPLDPIVLNKFRNSMYTKISISRKFSTTDALKDYQVQSAKSRMAWGETLIKSKQMPEEIVNLDPDHLLCYFDVKSSICISTESLALHDMRLYHECMQSSAEDEKRKIFLLLNHGTAFNTSDAIVFGRGLVKSSSFTQALSYASGINMLIQLIARTQDTQSLNHILEMIGLCIGTNPVCLQQLDTLQSYESMSCILQCKTALFDLSTLDFLMRIVGLWNLGEIGAICNKQVFESCLVRIVHSPELSLPLRMRILVTILNSIQSNSDKGHNLQIVSETCYVRWCLFTIFSFVDECLPVLFSILEKVLLNTLESSPEQLQHFMHFLLSSFSSSSSCNEGLLRAYLKHFAAKSLMSSKHPLVFLGLSDTVVVRLSLLKLLKKILELIAKNVVSSTKKIWTSIMKHLPIESFLMIMFQENDLPSQIEDQTSVIVVCIQILTLMCSLDETKYKELFSEASVTRIATILSKTASSPVLHSIIVSSCFNYSQEIDVRGIFGLEERITTVGQDTKMKLPKFLLVSEKLLSQALWFEALNTDESSLREFLSLTRSFFQLMKTHAHLWYAANQEDEEQFIFNALSLLCCPLFHKLSSETFESDKVLTELFFVILDSAMFPIFSRMEQSSMTDGIEKFLVIYFDDTPRDYVAFLNFCIVESFCKQINFWAKADMLPSSLLWKNISNALTAITEQCIGSCNFPRPFILVLQTFATCLETLDVSKNPVMFSSLDFQEEFILSVTRLWEQLILFAVSQSIRSDRVLACDLLVFVSSNHLLLFKSPCSSFGFARALFFWAFRQYTLGVDETLSSIILEVLKVILTTHFDALYPFLSLNAGKPIDLVKGGFDLLSSGKKADFQKWIQSRLQILNEFAVSNLDLVVSFESMIKSQVSISNARMLACNHDFKNDFSAERVLQKSISGELPEQCREIIQRGRVNQEFDTFCELRAWILNNSVSESSWHHLSASMETLSLTKSIRFAESSNVPFLFGKRWRIDTAQIEPVMYRKRIFRSTGESQNRIISMSRRFSISGLQKRASYFNIPGTELEIVRTHGEDEAPPDWEVPPYFANHKRVPKLNSHILYEGKRKQDVLWSDLVVEKTSEDSLSWAAWLRLHIDERDKVLERYSCKRLLLMEERKAVLVQCEDCFYIIADQKEAPFKWDEDIKLSDDLPLPLTSSLDTTRYWHEEITDIRKTSYLHRDAALEIFLDSGFCLFLILSAETREKAFKTMSSQMYAVILLCAHFE